VVGGEGIEDLVMPNDRPVRAVAEEILSWWRSGPV
jgi:hypothetical protein